MWWILLVLYVLLFMFNMCMHTFSQFYVIRYRNQEFKFSEIITCFLLSCIPIVNLMVTAVCIMELIEALYGHSIKDLIEKLCRTGLK